jgi:hypothetical protein
MVDGGFISNADFFGLPDVSGLITVFSADLRLLPRLTPIA